MTPTLIDLTRPQPAPAVRPLRDTAAVDEAWRRVLRALSGTDEDELPMFGRMPG